jgi:hypothetical protein
MVITVSDKKNKATKKILSIRKKNPLNFSTLLTKLLLLPPSNVIFSLRPLNKKVTLIFFFCFNREFKFSVY